jgi:hypothetical protein
MQLQFFIYINKRTKLSRFPVVVASIDNDESILEVIEDEDELDDDEDENQDQSANEDEEENANNSNTSQSSSIRVTTSDIVVRKQKSNRNIQDEYLSDNEQQNVIQPETRSLTLISLLERTFNLLQRCRQLVSDVRNIGVVDAYITMQIGGNRRGIVVDFEVNSCFLFCELY